MADATISSQSRLGLEQVSALCVRRDGNGRQELVAVGDEEFVVVTAVIDGGAVGDGARHDVGDVVEDPGKKSQWEAVATDGEGRAFALDEKHATVVVLSADLREQLHEIRLRAEDGPDERSAKLFDGKNKGPEGLLLLAGGHLLVIKQCKPVLLIEFGPRDDDPLGSAATLSSPGTTRSRCPTETRPTCSRCAPGSSSTRSRSGARTTSRSTTRAACTPSPRARAVSTS